MPSKFLASTFGFSMIRFQSLLACSHAGIFIGLSESFSTLLIASFLRWISFAFFFHKSKGILFAWFDKPSRGVLTLLEALAAGPPKS
jgi:hypothetical protein